ncbi:MAG: glycosyltransferase [Nitrospirota bacterium]
MQNNRCKQLTVLHVISSLERGGTETVLVSLVSNSSSHIRHIVVSLQDSGLFGGILRSSGVDVIELRMKRRRIPLFAALRLLTIIKKIKPDVVQTWMYHSDFLGGLISRLAGVRAVVWGIHSFNLDKDKISFSSRFLSWLSARLSSMVPAAIVCCSERAAQVHQDIGYQADKFVIIPNGCDLSRFFVDPITRNKKRAEWGIASHELLLGMVARFDPQKDHANLLCALALLAKQSIKFRCILVGKGMEQDNVALSSQIDRLDLSDHLILAGPQNDIPAIMNALDLHVLSSSGEAFPMVVIEAMACGTPCVVTDVGDTALIVGNTGWIVPPKDAAALAHGIAEGLSVLREKGRDRIGLVCRERVAERFTIQKMEQSYQELWWRLEKSRGVKCTTC